ncbi:MAG TPA: tripartite tricarboxylate transporter substrate binding protein [Burkholderiales bacterium]|nr:tripartite tricarboxylate transporter substrate binding protein [Burkholderiales bacterium]
MCPHPRLFASLTFLALFSLPAIAATPAYPDRPIRLIVPYAPGGNVDITARTVAPGMSEALGQQVVIDNRGGAGGRIGTAMAAKAPADGYTLVLGANGVFVVQPAFVDDIEYKPLRDFVFTSPISLMPGVLVVHPSVPVRTVKDLIALATARPNTLLMASAGVGSNVHLTGELFQSMAKVKFVHVPYKGGGASSADLIGGQVHLSFEPISTPIAHIRSGKLRAVAVTSRTRAVAFPNLPTIDESGVPGFESTTSTAIAMPAATPKDVVQKLRDALSGALDKPGVRQTFEKSGGQLFRSTPDEFVRKLQEEHARWVRIRKETGIRIE